MEDVARGAGAPTPYLVMVEFTGELATAPTVMQPAGNFPLLNSRLRKRDGRN